MRVADFIIDRLVKKHGIKVIPLLTGNGSLVINDAICKNKDVLAICVHHEQDAGYFALGHSKYTNKLSVVNPTTGCACTNCITPLLAAYQDHVPVIFLSGNVALNQTSRFYKSKFCDIKKLGVQELDIIEIVWPITKYAVMLTDKKQAKRELDKAASIALTPPFGPVWVDIPADIGASIISEEELEEYVPFPVQIEKMEKAFDSLLLSLEQSQKPLILVGQGIKLSDSREEFQKMIEKLQIPVVTTFGGSDLLDHNNPLNLGVIGIKGVRASDLALQNCDFLLCMGCCLNTPEIGYDPQKFAPQARKAIIDLDARNSGQRLNFNDIIECDLKDFLRYAIK